MKMETLKKAKDLDQVIISIKKFLYLNQNGLKNPTDFFFAIHQNEKYDKTASLDILNSNNEYPISLELRIFIQDFFLKSISELENQLESKLEELN